MARKTKETAEKKMREKEIPDYKVKLVEELASKIKKTKTFLIASTCKLPSSQFHEIKKNLRGKADIKVARKSAIIRAIDSIQSSNLQKMKDSVGADVAMFFSEMDPFELSGLLTESQSPSKAKAGDVAPEGINVEPGPTDLIPGPAISELSGVGLKVAVEGGKLAIKLPHIIVKKGDIIKENVAGVMAKLNIFPLKVGFEPIAAFDNNEDKLYVGIKIDKKQTLEDLRVDIAKARSFAIAKNYISPDTISYFIMKAGQEEKAIMAKVNTDTTTKEGN